jgi:hypothetical protein
VIKHTTCACACATPLPCVLAWGKSVLAGGEKHYPCTTKRCQSCKLLLCASAPNAPVCCTMLVPVQPTRKAATPPSMPIATPLHFSTTPKQPLLNCCAARGEPMRTGPHLQHAIDAPKYAKCCHGAAGAKSKVDRCRGHQAEAKQQAC